MENKATNIVMNAFTAIFAIAFVIGLVIFEVSLYTFFAPDGSPWLIMLIINAIYLVISFFIIGGLSMLGSFGMILGFIIAIAGLYILGLS